MKTTHTPGPWHLHGHDNARDCREVILSQWGEVCRVPHGNDFAIQQANAKLIAAAPELLAALQACSAQLLSLHSRGIDRSNATNACIDAARDAQAKASA